MQAMMTSGAIISVILLYLIYMVSCILAAYSLSYAFSKHETAQSTLTNIFIFVSCTYKFSNHTNICSMPTSEPLWRLALHCVVHLLIYWISLPFVFENYEYSILFPSFNLIQNSNICSVQPPNYSSHILYTYTLTRLQNKITNITKS